MDENNVQNNHEITDRQLETAYGIGDCPVIKAVEKTCQRCARSSAFIGRGPFKCPYCGHEEAIVM